MRKEVGALCGLTLAVAAGAAQADTIQTFDASGGFTGGATLSGTLNIDTTSGGIISSGLIVSAIGPLNPNLESQGFSTGEGGYAFQDNGLSNSASDLVALLNTSSLVGYTGGVFASQVNGPPNGYGETHYYDSTQGENVFLNVGMLTPAAPGGGSGGGGGPEPSTWALMMAGVFGVGLALRRQQHVAAERLCSTNGQVSGL